MSLAITYCRAQYGADAPLVTVETHLSNGLPAFNIVGLAQTAVKESKDRVRSALINSHFEFPQRRITVNLAPAELPKQGGRYDLAIAIGILAASKQIPDTLLKEIEFLGELSLSGEMRNICGSLPAAVQSMNDQRGLILPNGNAQDAALSQHEKLYAAQHLLEVCAHLNGSKPLGHISHVTEKSASYDNDFKFVKGQHLAKRALCIAAAGFHHVLMAGSPGSGKTLLANCLPSILPPMKISEAIETMSILSLENSQTLNNFVRPYCAPHHSASAVALVGGGNPPRPGEISRAHNGVLFLDELPEFQRGVLETLREPLESGEIIINRAAHKVKFKSRFMLVAAMNCCPCGFYMTQQTCRCSLEQIQRYQNKISGPLLDRIDIQLFIRPVQLKTIQTNNEEKVSSSAELQAQVLAAHHIQMQRQQKNNANLSQAEIKEFCVLCDDDQQWFLSTLESLNISMRGYYRMLKVARSIADLEQQTHIQRKHLQEALHLRLNISAQQKY